MGPGGFVGLRLLKVNFPWFWLAGLTQGVVFPDPWSLLVQTPVEATAASKTLSGPGPVESAGTSLSGGRKPWMVLETRAETVTRLRSAAAGRLCRLVEVVELSEEEVAVRGGFAPFCDATGVWTPFTVAPFEGLDVSPAEAPDWTGGRGARYLTLAGCDWAGLACVDRGDSLFGGTPDGIGGAGDLMDLGLGTRGLD